MARTFIKIAVLSELPHDPNEGVPSDFYFQRYRYGLRADGDGFSSKLYFRCAPSRGVKADGAVIEVEADTPFVKRGGRAGDDSPTYRMALLRAVAHKLATGLDCASSANIPATDQPYINQAKYD
ncbi:hypothetical protein SRB5_49930 [Streptomyces sp. RB5]|uniref:Uncharacterized protein n=2 Tax=Streptomyces smaragdinus TaxID=2585196 RepID=A0A7K0CMV6_9ACTN|nr:hypothetical protein [Streptomyces smaragdinus]